MKKIELHRILIIILFLLLSSTIQISWANKQKNSDEFADISITLISPNRTFPVQACSFKSMMVCTILLWLMDPMTPGILNITNNSSTITATNIDVVLPSALEEGTFVQKSRAGCNIVPPGSTCTISFLPISGPVAPQPVPITGNKIRPATFNLGIVP